jgi:chromosome segregation protein
VHLKSIKLRGFKSFSEPVEVRLEPGVAVVVGPNGSGKSNVSDAILWATGVMSPSELRAEKPDDVLFAGSAGAKAVDFCDVELVFDNEDGGFGEELGFSEVSIARRLHRGGEGQYLVNRASVRRLDLVELLADVGLGGGLRSVISQGRVEAVLSSKPSERRELIEQAAGLGKFKSRRHRAELKLSRVAIQVERARDLEDEVKKRLRPLALQATAAERAEKLLVEIARLAARIATLDLESLDERIAEAAGRRQAAALARKDADTKLEAVLLERNAAEEELADAAGGREGATAALYRLRSAGERLGLRRESAQTLLATVRSEIALAQTRSPGAEAELERIARDAAAAAREAEAQRRVAAGRARTAFERAAAVERDAQAELQARLEELLTQRDGLEAQLAGAAGGREGAASALLRLRSAGERLALRRESAHSLLDAARADLIEAQSVPDGPRPEELEAVADAADASARAATRERDTLAERARAAKERLETLERSLAEREGIPPAARALAEEGERLALSSLEVPAGSERAVAAALGPRASALLADDARAGFRLLERAREAGLGSLLVLVGRQPRELVAALPVLAEAALLESTIPAVTADGYGYDPERGELWFAGETAEAVLFELEARRRALADEAAGLDRATERAAAVATRADQQARSAAAAYAEVAHLKRSRAADPATLSRLVGAAERLDAAVAVDFGRFEEPLRERAEAGGTRAGELGEELRRLGGAEADIRRELAEISGRAAKAEQAVAQLGVDAIDSDLRPEEAEQHLLAAAAAAAAAQERARDAADAYDEAVPRHLRELDPERLGEIAARALRLDEALAAAAVTAAAFETPLQAKVDAGAQRATVLAARLRELGAAEASLRGASAEAGERSAGVDVEIARLEADAEEARRRLATAGAEPAEGDDRDTLVERLDRLERRREQLGQVNPLAKEEYEAEQERLEELALQRRDLEDSLRELQELRDDLTRTVEERFTETFAAVERHFAEVSETLFPGGEGRLRLVDPEEEGAEPGVEVELRPAGKRVTRLSLLSGGEKALGAIAFLFSLFLARPAPFYLLDEVEAALDDTNIGRFVELLRRYADRAQFIVITHQKRTMEAADVLYGVTMRDGASQILSRRLPRDEQASASA